MNIVLYEYSNPFYTNVRTVTNAIGGALIFREYIILQYFLTDKFTAKNYSLKHFVQILYLSNNKPTIKNMWNVKMSNIAKATVSLNNKSKV